MSNKVWRLTKDGTEILVGTETECWNWLHSNTSSSVSWACKYEGYKLEPIGSLPVAGLTDLLNIRRKLWR